VEVKEDETKWGRIDTRRSDLLCIEESGKSWEADYESESTKE
jgi:hypothetical protein